MSFAIGYGITPWLDNMGEAAQTGSVLTEADKFQGRRIALSRLRL